MTLYCMKSSKCKQYISNDKVSFNGITYNSQNNDKTVINHSLIITDDESKVTFDAFTLNEVDNEYKLDELNNSEELNILNKNGDNNNINKIKVNSNEYIKSYGIGLMAACRYDIEKVDGTKLTPNE
ncbi:hypothetical protein BCR36DRAFT_408921 [Piromyces finnis]|uniref:Uncharacterized protein n=1 Tax=Piromyces finnis TaxID=1754191 RepID=A0A1Y1VK35_9FUNG|nr:hypothetical protein BCR36DRAFT_408921 [Piromyces finnis]|eukprot:ORX58405.1 hypothetical protein BCR36DRAFT_408921 [Piromyces finnis]